MNRLLISADDLYRQFHCSANWFWVLIHLTSLFSDCVCSRLLAWNKVINCAYTTWGLLCSHSQVFFMHCMYNVKMHWWVILHAHQAVRWTGKKVKCTSCELLYTEIVKLYTSIKRVYKKNGGVQPWGYRVLPSFLLWLLDLCMHVQGCRNTIHCRTKWNLSLWYSCWQLCSSCA